MERVYEIIEEQLHLTGVDITDDLTFKDDLGADSIDLVELFFFFAFPRLWISAKAVIL